MSWLSLRLVRRWLGADPWGQGGLRRRWRTLPALVWLAFILFPLADAIGHSGSVLEHILAIAAAAAFCSAYVGIVVMLFRPGLARVTWVLLGLLVVLSIALTLADASSWAFLFTYCAACGALVLPSPIRFPFVLVCTGLATGCSALAGADGGTVISFGASTVGVGLLMVLLSDLRERNQELSEARAELARAAVAKERERFARDLHDLLGHSLSVIAIKAELAGRLLPDRPDRAHQEVSEVEQVARQALGEVRQAVSGYRRPTLDGELEGARMALSAAGIEAAFDRSPVVLDPEIEAVLAWAVREGATNVIRHSGARRCQVTVRAGGEEAAVEVVDDGAGCPAVNGGGERVAGGHGGNGIAGLAERAERLRGCIEAGRRSDEGGFRLAVSVPMSGSTGS